MFCLGAHPNKNLFVYVLSVMNIIYINTYLPLNINLLTDVLYRHSSEVAVETEGKNVSQQMLFIRNIHIELKQIFHK